MRMPRKDGLAVVRDLGAEKLPTRVILLVVELDDDALPEAMRLAASAVVLKEVGPRLLVQSPLENRVSRRSHSSGGDCLVRQENE